jgi:hypothetical protein
MTVPVLIGLPMPSLRELVEDELGPLAHYGLAVYEPARAVDADDADRARLADWLLEHPRTPDPFSTREQARRQAAAWARRLDSSPAPARSMAEMEAILATTARSRS